MFRVSALSFFTQNLILKNEFVLITSFTILLMCTPLTPPSYGELFSTELAPIFLRHSLIFIYVHLFLFVRTSFYLSEPILICQNLFLFVKTYFHLCALIFVCENLFLFMIIFENLFLFMIICENLFFKVFMKISSVWTPSSKTNLLSLKQDNDFWLLISYVLILCFLLCIFLILCLTICLFNKMLVYSSNVIEIFTPFVEFSLC